MGQPHRLPLKLAEHAELLPWGQSRAGDWHAVHSVPGVAAAEPAAKENGQMSECIN